MLMINYSEAISTLSELTKQKCNHFTLLHYISNGYLDVFIKGNFDICWVTSNGYQVDEEYLCHKIDKGYMSYLKIDNEDIELNMLNECLLNDERSLEIISVNKIGSDTKWILTKNPLNGSTHPLVKELSELSTPEPIELAFIVSELGTGQHFSRNDILFDFDQIKKLKPIISALRPQDVKIFDRNLRTGNEKELGIKIIKEIHKVLPTLGRENMSLIINVILQMSNIDTREDDTLLKWYTESGVEKNKYIKNK